MLRRPVCISLQGLESSRQVQMNASVSGLMHVKLVIDGMGP